MAEISTKPYLIRAIYEWCTDSGYRPHIAVVVDEHTVVPREFVRSGEIVLNVSAHATNRLRITNEVIEFEARFGGVARPVSIPIDNVSAIYAQENGHGMAFEVPKALALVPEPEGEPGMEDEPSDDPAREVAPEHGEGARRGRGGRGARRATAADDDARLDAAQEDERSREAAAERPWREAEADRPSRDPGDDTASTASAGRVGRRPRLAAVPSRDDGAKAPKPRRKDKLDEIGAPSAERGEPSAPAPSGKTAPGRRSGDAAGGVQRRGLTDAAGPESGEAAGKGRAVPEGGDASRAQEEATRSRRSKPSVARVQPPPPDDDPAPKPPSGRPRLTRVK